MPQVHEGGCVCGAVRYKVKADPVRSGVCHCTFCQRRSGSAFATVSYFKDSDVEIRGSLKTYEHRSDETNRWLKMEFCPNCGTTVTWTLEFMPGARGIAGGTFDDPSWLRIERATWMRSAQPWVIMPGHVEKFPQGSLKQPLQVK
jgi:hypothetical protein